MTDLDHKLDEQLGEWPGWATAIIAVCERGLFEASTPDAVISEYNRVGRIVVESFPPSVARLRLEEALAQTARRALARLDATGDV